MPNLDDIFYEILQKNIVIFLYEIPIVDLYFKSEIYPVKD